MNYTTFQKILKQSLERLSNSWKSNHENLFQDEYFDYLSKVLHSYIFKNEKIFFTEPAFEEEILVDFSLHLKAFENIKTNSFEELENALFRAFKRIKTESILIILGQRLTPASLRNENAFPPLQKDLFNASFEAYNTQISKATRAWEKHSGRSKDSIWGTIKGTPEEREQKVRQIVKQILAEKTWWNIYLHYKHELVYEARLKSGHGIRWKLSNLDLLGFVEPFDGEY